jgi:hypothetical protein
MKKEYSGAGVQLVCVRNLPTLTVVKRRPGNCATAPRGPTCLRNCLHSWRGKNPNYLLLCVAAGQVRHYNIFFERSGLVSASLP